MSGAVKDRHSRSDPSDFQHFARDNLEFVYAADGTPDSAVVMNKEDLSTAWAAYNERPHSASDSTSAKALKAHLRSCYPAHAAVQSSYSSQVKKVFVGVRFQGKKQCVNGAAAGLPAVAAQADVHHKELEAAKQVRIRKWQNAASPYRIVAPDARST